MCVVVFSESEARLKLELQLKQLQSQLADNNERLSQVLLTV